MLPALLQVQGTHPYAGEDTDELTFDAGDVINVLPFEDPEDQVRDANRFRTLTNGNVPPLSKTP